MYDLSWGTDLGHGCGKQRFDIGSGSVVRVWCERNILGDLSKVRRVSNPTDECLEL